MKSKVAERDSETDSQRSPGSYLLVCEPVSSVASSSLPVYLFSLLLETMQSVCFKYI